MNIYIRESELMRTLQAQLAKGVKPVLSIVKFSLAQDEQGYFVLVASQINLDFVTCYVEKKAYIDFKTKTVVSMEDTPLQAKVFSDLTAFEYYSVEVIADTKLSTEQILIQSDLSKFTIEQVNPLLEDISPKQLCYTCGTDPDYCEACEAKLIHVCPTCGDEVSYDEKYISNEDEHAAACLTCNCFLLGLEVMKVHPLEFMGDHVKLLEAKYSFIDNLMEKNFINNLVEK